MKFKSPPKVEAFHIEGHVKGQCQLWKLLEVMGFLLILLALSVKILRNCWLNVSYVAQQLEVFGLPHVWAQRVILMNTRP